MDTQATASCGLHVRQAIEEDSVAIVDILNQTFRTPIDNATWRWYTEGNPLGPSRVYVAETEDDGIAGVIAFAPMVYRLNGRGVPGTYAHHLAFKPRYWNTVSYLLLCGRALAAEKEHAVELTIGPPNKRAYPIHKVLGKWFDFGRLDCLRKFPPYAQAHSCMPLDRFTDEFDAFYSRLARRLDFCVEKNADWMNWRFFRRPGLPYTVYTAREAGVLAGYIVLKRWTDPDGYRKAHILDLHAANESAAAKMLQAAESYAAGCGELNLWAAQGCPYRKWLEASGFLPSHRQPLLARTLNGSTVRYPSGPCCLSYGDGDSQY